MRIIITEDKLSQIIVDYLDKYYDFNDINYTYYIDDNYNESDNAIQYYLGDYGDDNTIFRIYKEDYWYNEDDFRKKLSPILMVEDEDLVSSLFGLFGDRWKPVMAKWFENNFDEEVKTVDHY